MTDNLVDALSVAVVPPVAIGIIVLARRYLPAKPGKELNAGHSIQELDAHFNMTQWLFGMSMILVSLGFAWGAYSAVLALNQFFVSLEGPSDFVLLPEGGTWLLLPAIGAFTLGWEITLYLWSLLGGKKEAALFSYWTSTKAGFDLTRFLRIAAAVVVLPIAIFTALAIPEHTVLQKNAIKARGLWFSNLTYRYDAAKKMTVVKGARGADGKFVRRAGILLDFADGRRWSSADIGEPLRTVDSALVTYIQHKTGLEPQYRLME